ncbi:MAG: hypothetical protein K0S41_3018 [Anaerocolumna sp.]|jgi:hypothetical protein|nr:hypothetical protein [Anaerocolumna sp.]
MLKKYIPKLIVVILILISFIILQQAFLEKDYKAIIKFLTVPLSMCIGLVIDKKLIIPLRIKSKHLDRFNTVVLVIYALFIIIVFLGYVVIRNTYISSIYNGLIFTSIYFCKKYWDELMKEDDDYID